MQPAVSPLPPDTQQHPPPPSRRVLLDFPLPIALYKKLLGQHVGLRDLEDMQPRLGRSLRQLLQFEGDTSVEVGRGGTASTWLTVDG